MTAVLSLPPYASPFSKHADSGVRTLKGPSTTTKSSATLASKVASFVNGSLFAEPVPPPSKRILIIGAGTGGIGSLLGLLAVPEEHRKGWEIEVVDKRDNVAGVWYPQENPPSAPALPDTPLYPALHTNTPSPTMTFPEIPFPAGTPLFPSHDHVRRYHELVVKERKLEPYLRLSHSVNSAEWDDEKSEWKVEIEHEGQAIVKSYNHLVVANGHYKYPSSVSWKGQEEWLKSGDREIVHSLWYRGPEKYAGRVVVVIGYGGSGLDVAGQTATTAETVYHSYSPRDPDSILNTIFPSIPGTVTKPRISHFTADKVFFDDGTTISNNKVSVILCTGYNLLAPFLKDLNEGVITSATTSLTTNGDYIRPLHHAIFSADARYPRDALSFISIPFFIANGPNAFVQGLFLGHSFASADGTFLPSQEEALKELGEREEVARAAGFDHFKTGNSFYASGQAEEYQENLFKLIKTRSKVPLPQYLQGRDNYIEDWRRFGRMKAFFLRKGWRRAVELGVEKDFVSQVRSEEEWAKTLYKMDDWEKAQDLIKVRGYMD